MNCFMLCVLMCLLKRDISVDNETFVCKVPTNKYKMDKG